MSDDLTRLEEWAAPLLARLEPQQRRVLAHSIGTELRRSQQQRIRDQKNPDGSAFAPRKIQQNAQSQTGRIRRRAMFMKIRQNKYLKTRTTAGSVSVGFFGRVSRIARVHQHGLRDRASVGGPEIRYEQRELLGFSQADMDMITDKLTHHLV
jgi:phage virion morphogenesis protein